MIVKDYALLLKLDKETITQMLGFIPQQFILYRHKSPTPNSLFLFTKLDESHLHLTLTNRKKFAIYNENFVIPENLKIPKLEFEEEVYMVSRTKNLIKKKSLVIRIRNQSEVKEFVDKLYGLQNPCFHNPEPDREFHITIANNQAGDPFCSIGDVGRLKRDFMNKIN